MRKQAIYLIVGRGLASALQAATIILLARSITIASFGIVNAVTGFLLAMGMVLDLGLSTYLIKARALGDSGRVVVILKIYSILTMASASISAVVIAALATRFNFDIAISLLGISAALERNVETLVAIPIADGDRFTPSINVLARRSVALALFSAGLVLHLNPLLVFSASQLMSGVVGRTLLIRRLGRNGSKVPTISKVRVIREALPFLVSNVAGQARTIDTSLVSALAGANSGGLYAAAIKLTNPLLLIPQSLSAVVLPHAARASVLEVKKIAIRLVAFHIALLIGLIPGMIFARPVMELAFGTRYAAASSILVWALASLPFIGLSTALESILQGQERQRFVSLNGSLFLAVTLVLLVSSTLLYGPTGAAISIFASFAMKDIVLFLGVARLGKIPNREIVS